MSPEDRLELLRTAPPDTWIALSDDESRLAGKGKTYQEAVDDAARSGSNDPILIRIPPTWAPLVLRCESTRRSNVVFQG